MNGLQEVEFDEIEPAHPDSEEFEAKYPCRASDNPSIGRCIRAYNRAYRQKLKELEDGERDNEAVDDGKESYLRALPPLTGAENIRDFIACVTYARIIEIICQKEAENLFAAAKIALSASRRET